MRYVVQKNKDGTFSAAMQIPVGDGSLASVSKGLTAAEATVKAARTVNRTASATGTLAASTAAKKANTVAALAKVAANPTLRSALKAGGLEAAKAAAAFIPGGSLALKALDLASKFGPAKKLLGKFLKF